MAAGEGAHTQRSSQLGFQRILGQQLDVLKLLLRVYSPGDGPQTRAMGSSSVWDRGSCLLLCLPTCSLCCLHTSVSVEVPHGSWRHLPAGPASCLGTDSDILLGCFQVGEARGSSRQVLLRGPQHPDHHVAAPHG